MLLSSKQVIKQKTKYFGFGLKCFVDPLKSFDFGQAFVRKG